MPISLEFFCLKKVLTLKGHPSILIKVAGRHRDTTKNKIAQHGHEKLSKNKK